MSFLLNFFENTLKIKDAKIAKSLQLLDKFIMEAKSQAIANRRSFPRQIEYYYRLGKIAEENPDLPMSFIKESLLAKAEMEAGNLTLFAFSKD